tara:strand:+ start:186 stop:641 length:456 start_codon:yes stop_codon:yes gene_type:complete
MADNSDNSNNSKINEETLEEQINKLGNINSDSDIHMDTEETLEEQMNKLGDGNAFADIINNLKTLGNEENLNNLFKDFTDSFQNCTNNNNNNNNSNQDDEEEYVSDNYDFETLNLDKYLLDDNGTNICSILSKINNQLQNINDNLNKMHDK